MESGGGLPPELINLIDNSDEGVDIEQDNCVLSKKNKDSKPVGNAKKLMISSSIVLSKVSNVIDKDNDFNKFKLILKRGWIL